MEETRKGEDVLVMIPKEELEKKIAEGYTRKEISAQIGISETTIRKWSRRWGVEYKKNTKPYSDQELAQLKKLASDGVKNAEIARIMGKTANAIVKKRQQLALNKRDIRANSFGGVGNWLSRPLIVREECNQQA